MNDRQTAPEIVMDGGSCSVRGIHRLAGAVLIQAIEDAWHGAGKKREAAIRWLDDSRDDHFSFAFCCRMMNCDPEKVRRRLQRQKLRHWLCSALNDPARATMLRWS